MCVCPSGREHMLEPGVLWKSLLPSPHPWTLLSDCTVSLSPQSPPQTPQGRKPGIQEAAKEASGLCFGLLWV